MFINHCKDPYFLRYFFNMIYFGVRGSLSNYLNNKYVEIIPYLNICLKNLELQHISCLILLVPYCMILIRS
jgi:hypothetical protein